MSVGQDQPLAEELDGTGGGDTGGADEQLAGASPFFAQPEISWWRWVSRPIVVAEVVGTP